MSIPIQAFCAPKELFFFHRYLSSPPKFLFPSPAFIHCHQNYDPKTQTQNKNLSFFRICSSHEATTTTTTSREPLTIYLTETLGFSDELATVTTQTLINDPKNPLSSCQVTTDITYSQHADNVIKFLQSECGFNTSDIKELVSKHPRLLVTNVDKTLKPKIMLLEEVGLSTLDLPNMLCANPALLECDLRPAIDALRDIMGSDEGVLKVFKQLFGGSSPTDMKNIIPNVTMLENEYGISRDKIWDLLAKDSKIFTEKQEWLRGLLVKIEEKWGIKRDSRVFLKALRVFSHISDEEIEAKCRVFRGFGWKEIDIQTLAKGDPRCFGFSEARIKKTLEFYKKELGYKPVYIASRPVLITVSLENRAVPRHRVLSILKNKGLIRAKYQLSTALSFTDSIFYDKFVLPHEHAVPKLRKVYTDGKVSSRTEIAAL